MNGQVRNAFYLTCAALTAAILLSLFTGLVRQLGPDFRARIKQKAASAPLFKQAAKLGLTYEAVLAAPANALGKPALWCVHLSSRQAYCGPGRDKPLNITNAGEMPWQLYGRHSGDYECRAALLEITGVKTFDFEGARAVRPQARFLDYK